jgi:selenocysteine lyase/cysteine desulfurase
MNTPSPEVQRAARDLREALEQHQYAMHHGTPADTIHTAEEVEAARARLKAVCEAEEQS